MPAPDEILGVRLAAAEPAVLAIACSEPPAQEAFRALLTKRHGEAAVELVSVPGGAWWVARAANATRSRARRWVAARVADSVEDAIEAALARQSLKAVELLGHQGCGWYSRVSRGATQGELVRRQGEDLYVAAEELARWSRLPVAGRIVLESADGGSIVRTLFG
jgi:hypothetical protein